MDRGNNTTCTINLHGATIVSWRVNNQARDNVIGSATRGSQGSVKVSDKIKTADRSLLWA